MKKISYLLIFTFLFSCTSNTILEKPKDLIPRDSMRLLIQEMMIASSAKYMKNKNLETKVEYMPLVYDQFKIDSVRFQNSNLYYMSKIDLYQQIFEDAKTALEKQKKFYSDRNTRRDSIRNDSLKKLKKEKKNFMTDDSLVLNKKEFKVKKDL
ncbi:DUF4296 domain-containing protein [Polaribacter glomeratus]|uniref:DUF4296 domain-containing protein n=1 Tax=Polaribacter glomeratus TaxID=102 RepID=A0A2S7WJJ3_9FLAO|nr:DUF4296 domain-containing protein [Polaribacter glomeratus]PQJ77606.1 hypothetical protein BTO16_13270 [Polaribacter glomeratus]TXD67320.1 DUF4296 domain-containing protein [Polaribacter glomeratus]